MGMCVRWAGPQLPEVVSAQPEVVGGQCEQTSHPLCPATTCDNVELVTVVSVFGAPCIGLRCFNE